VLAEDNPLVSEGLEQLLTGSAGLEVVAAGADLDSLREAIAGKRPDVVVTDIRMPPARTDEGIRVAEELHVSARCSRRSPRERATLPSLSRSC
jgi:DNA-binding NarL/FixJ family response regulator